MKTFDEKDLIMWSNCDQAKIGEKYYFAYTLDDMKDKVKRGVIRKLISADFHNYAYTFCSDGLTCYPCILPVDKVIEEEPEKKYRPCKTIKEFYRVVMNDLPPLNMVVESDFIYDLIDRDIHLRSKKTGTKYYSSIRSISEDVNGYINVSITSTNYLSFDELFSNYEIEINGEWKPFGILDD